MRVSATLVALALGMTACSGGGDGGDAEEPNAAETGAAEAPSGGTFSIGIGEPENPLVPSNTSETEGGQLVDALFTGLVQYDPDTTEQIEGVAESIESGLADLDDHA
jgi:peptide/nickel transport system substrate-binding protein/oligopeptide transport system substrate-binding protein